MKYYVGLDLSLCGTGIAIIDQDSKLYYNKTIKVKSKGEDRLIQIRDAIAEAFTGFQSSVKRVIVEGYSYGSKSASLPFQIGELGGVIKTWLHENRYDFTVIAPATLTKHIAGMGNFANGLKNKKILKRDEVNKKWGTTFTDHNQSDAYGLAQYGREVLDQ